jgi:hypothetical protein
MSHSKGPWRAEPMPRDGRIYIWSNGLKIAEVIALADFDFDNAKLITAAPELLTALKLMVADREADGYGSREPALTAKAALAKAGAQ